MDKKSLINIIKKSTFYVQLWNNLSSCVDKVIEIIFCFRYKNKIYLMQRPIYINFMICPNKLQVVQKINWTIKNILMNSQIPTKLIGSTNRITGLFLKVRRLSWSQFKDKAISKKLS